MNPKKWQGLLAGLLLAAGLNGCNSVPATPQTLKVSFGKADSEIEKLIVAEATAYFGRIFVEPVAITEQAAPATVIIGTPQSNPLIQRAMAAGLIALPEGKNADQGYAIKTVGGQVYVAASTAQGALYGVYELLERYGVYFQINGERLPAKSVFVVKPLNVCVAPVFKYRGLLPWDNFLCGMSGWNLEHYQEFIARAARMKFNLLQFHFYPGMAFFTEEWNGKPVDPTVIGMPVDVFKTKGAIGEPLFGGAKLFGCKPYVDNMGKPRQQAEHVQAMMRQVIDYAHGRGVKTCVGFELMHAVGGKFTFTEKPADGNGGANFHNPLDAGNATQSVERLRALMKTYPNSDYYWMWQSEARGYLARNVGREPGAKEMREQFKHWAGDPNRAGDIDYAYLFREVANRLTPQERARLATGGWSIEHIFPGIDADFPKELTFASLNTHDPKGAQGLVPSYRAAQSGRKAWMIDWWEFDGIQWFPQFRVDWQEEMYQACVGYGVEGVSLLGWKLSGVEHNVRFLADFSWNPKLTAKDFYADYCRRAYGAAAGSLASIYERFDKYDPLTPTTGVPGYPAKRYFANGWCQVEPPKYPNRPKGLEEADWKNMVAAVPSHIQELRDDQQMNRQAIGEFRTVMPQLDAAGQSLAALMINRFEARIHYLELFIALDESIAAFDAAARKEGLEKGRAAACPHAQRALRCAQQAVETYAADIRNRNDLGVVAQMNEQVFKIYKKFAVRLGADKTAYAEIDQLTFRLTPVVKFDFSGQPPWASRDGKATRTTAKVDGKPTLRIELGEVGAQTQSAFIHAGQIDLENAPFVDFRIRTTTHEPLAIMFLTADGQWRALNLIGKQTGYASLDELGGVINDGNWHRVTWNLQRLFKGELETENFAITSVILGSWEKLSAPIVVEFQDFAFGKQNTLD